MRIMARTLLARDRSSDGQPETLGLMDGLGWSVARAVGLLAGAAAILVAGAVGAQQSPSPNQPLAIPDQVRMGPTCPLIVPRQDFALQPLRLPPAQVPAKNAVGCLSPADALYGPDGCPVKLCKESSGTVPLPGT